MFALHDCLPKNVGQKKLEAGKKLGTKNIGIEFFCWYKASYRVKIMLHTENQLPRYCGSGLNMYGFGFCCAAVLTAFYCLEQQQHRVSLVVVEQKI